MRISDWSSDVCSSDLNVVVEAALDVLENLDLDIEPADLGEARDRQVVEADGEPEGLDRVGAVAGFRHLTPPASRPGWHRCRGRPAPDRLRPSQAAPGATRRARAAGMRHRQNGRASCRARVWKSG